MKKSKKNNIIPRILISLLGLALILWAISLLALGILGESSDATITSIRRQGGERDEAIPGRYAYQIGYTFSLPDGRKYYGWQTKIAGNVYLKADGKSIRSVRYLKKFPYINALEEDTKFNQGKVVLILVGGFLIYVINKKRE